MSLAALGLLFIALGGGYGVSFPFGKQAGEARTVAMVLPPSPRSADPNPARGEFRQGQRATEPEAAGKAGASDPDPDDLEYERSLGSILVRVTGAGGSFRVTGASDVAYRLLIYEPLAPFPCATLEEVRPADQELLVRIDRDSLSSSYFPGRVLDPTGAPVGGVKRR